MVDAQTRFPPEEYDAKKMIGDLEIQTDHLIPVERLVLDIVKNKKKNLSNSELYHPGRPRSENKGKRKMKQVLRTCQQIGNQWSIKVMLIPVVTGALGTIPKRSARVLEG